MLDAMPDGEPVHGSTGPCGITRPARQGVAAGAVPVRGPVFGGNRRLLGIAVAIELLHNAFLVHDDIADGSEMRRGRPTLAAARDGGRTECR